MGDDLADNLAFGAPQASPSSPITTHREFRTQPLWGVSMHAPFLHDGRAETLLEEIEMHAGEAAAIRDAFLALSPAERRALQIDLGSIHVVRRGDGGWRAEQLNRISHLEAVAEAAP